jgi:hypothetical protein
MTGIAGVFIAELTSLPLCVFPGLGGFEAVDKMIFDGSHWCLPWCGGYAGSHSGYESKLAGDPYGSPASFGWASSGDWSVLRPASPLAKSRMDIRN